LRWTDSELFEDWIREWSYWKDWMKNCWRKRRRRWWIDDEGIGGYGGLLWIVVVNWRLKMMNVGELKVVMVEEVVENSWLGWLEWWRKLLDGGERRWLGRRKLVRGEGKLREK
jgi:hypothetical protein